MLAQNFKTAADLGITEPQRQALMKTLVLLETGKLRHVPEGTDWGLGDPIFAGQFNMNQWLGRNECGSVCCIGGTAQLIGDLTPHEMEDAASKNQNLWCLFYPDVLKKNCHDWAWITDAQAAIALRSYLTTGDSRWDLAIGEAS